MKRSLLIALSQLLFLYTYSCTTFFINNNGKLVFGGNYDWVSGTGLINTNQRGLFKTSMKIDGANSASWVSKFGSISFNQYGQEFPTAGMNEKGLVVELMWLDGTVYPKADDRPAMGVLQWIQYQLDNSATIEDIIASDKMIRITEKGTPLHYLVADAKGNAATIEFLNGQMKVHRDKDLPLAVLTNGTYASSINTVKEEKENSEKTFQDNSLDRFVKACRMVENVKRNDMKKEDLVSYAFNILEKVSQGNFTKWSIVFDLSDLKIHFKTSTEKNTRTIAFGSFDFTCSTPTLSYDLDKKGLGEISKDFSIATGDLRRKVLRRAAEESSQYVSISNAEVESLLKYQGTVTCKQ